MIGDGNEVGKLKEKIRMVEIKVTFSGFLRMVEETRNDQETR